MIPELPIPRQDLLKPMLCLIEATAAHFQRSSRTDDISACDGNRECAEILGIFKLLLRLGKALQVGVRQTFQSVYLNGKIAGRRRIWFRG